MNSVTDTSGIARSPEDGQEDFLAIDPGVMQDSGDKHTSLEDLYGYDVFSEKYEAGYQKVKKNEADEREKVLQQVFRGQKSDAVQQAFETVMHADHLQVVQADYQPPSSGSEILRGISFTALGMGIALAIGLMIRRAQKRKQKNENYDHNSTAFHTEGV